MSFLRIINPGLLTTIQDRGRFYYQKWGVPVAGAVDEYSLRAANMLVDNREGEGCLEITLFGPTIEFMAPGLIALTGADLGARLNGKNCLPWESYRVDKGDVLDFTSINSGCRAYLAAAGGFNVAEVMGSKSTYLRAGIGGLNGRPFGEGDELDINTKGDLPAPRAIPLSCRPELRSAQKVRAVPGPQDDAFTREGFRTFLESEYKVRHDSDRMGCRLEGPEIEHAEKADIVSDGIAAGSVQVPGNGNPIVMLSDRQTTGGYTKIATVITPDMWKLAQAKPGDSIRFKEVTLEEARKAYFEYENLFNQLPEKMIEKSGKGTRVFLVNVSGLDYKVEIEER